MGFLKSLFSSVPSLDFREWFFSEAGEKGVFAYKKPNPKNPEKKFIVLYGNTYPIKDELKKLKFKYFSGTWSIPEDSATPEIADFLKSHGIDLNEIPAQNSPAPETEPSAEQKKTDDFLEKMHTSVEDMKKDADTPEVKKLLSTIDKMIEDLANSTDEAAQQKFIKSFLDFSSRFYNYSFNNQILIWVQTKGKANYVMAASKWPDLGRQVTKWNEGITIIRPNFKTIEKDKLDPATNQPQINPLTGKAEKDKYQLKFFKAAKVYDVSSTEEIPGHESPFKPMTRSDWSVDSNEANEEINLIVNGLMDWIKKKDIDIDTEELSSEVGGYSAGGKIRINNTFAGVNLLSTLSHEVAHELLHWKDPQGKSSTSQQKEIDAEAVAYIVSRHFGFESKDSPNYLALWRAKGENVRERQRFIQDAAKTIIQGIKSEVESKEIDFDQEEQID